ncbi:MAG: hypothetical protein GEU76_07725 [Alphaproteobacteria bacterium]|nr:hypothetical protein [Alphaproteobacteria bacterium]
MDLTRVPHESLPSIRAYGGGGFRIAGAHYTSAVLVHPGGICPLGLVDMVGFGAAFAREIADLAPRPDLLLVGTGETIEPLADDALGVLRAAAIAVETMATGPACRTFNVLLGEGRRVAAVLFPVA